jgi:predicted phosphohydrolase
MNIRYFSDLHLELVKPDQLDSWLEQIQPGEVCILAGDIGHPREPNYDKLFQCIRQRFVKIFVIPGNHEYYYHSMEDTNQWMETYFRSFENVTFLKDRCEVYGGVCFVGTTLWTNIIDPKYKINDVYSIPRFDYHECNRLHRKSLAFLKEALRQENCVVITHHVPSSMLIDRKYFNPEMMPYHQWFACEMDAFFLPNVKAWFYGHTHTASRRRIQNIPFLCNPIGYPGENVADFGATFVLETE